MKKIIMLLIVFLVSISGVGAYTIDSDLVYTNTSDVYLGVRPHTPTEDGTIQVGLISKTLSGNIDLAIGFNSSDAIPSNPEFRKLINTTYTCNASFNYTISPKHFWCFNETVNGTVHIFNHSFDSGDLPSQTATWEEMSWVDLSIDGILNHSFDGKDRWYYIQNINIERDKLYALQFFLNISGDGKYDVAIKPSSESISEAINNNHFLFLDPWWNDSFVSSSGTKTTDGDYTVVTFLTSGTFNITRDLNITSLIVAGGGAGTTGGGNGGGGGGAGGLIYNSSYTLSAGVYNITIGTGGTGTVYPNNGGSGGNSVFNSLTAIGGGGGGSHQNANENGDVGGSGGGGGGYTGGIGGAGTAGQGFAGGNGRNSGLYSGGGGGGASEVGKLSGSDNVGADGGDGLNYSINGSNIYYAGGGAGGIGSGGTTGNGGLGGGGDGGAYIPVNAGNGTDGLGGGGGGSSQTSGADGGDGVVIIRYLTSDLNTSSNTAPSISATNINPSSPVTSNDLEFNTTCIDPDSGDSLTVYLQVYNGTSSYGSVQSQSATNNTDTSIYNLSNTATLKGESWKGEYWCGDGTDNSTKTNSSAVTIGNTAPTVTETIPDYNITHNNNLVIDFNCSDVDSADTITYTDNTSLFVINSGTGVISDNPTQGETGVYSVRLTCSDGTNQATEDFTYTITNTAPTFDDSILDATIMNINNLSFQVNCSDSDSDSITYYDNTSLFNINDSGYIFDDPTPGETGNYIITITCGDGALNTTDEFWYNITATELVISKVDDYPINSSAGAVGEYNFSNIQEIEKMILSFNTVFNTTIDTWYLNFTANGTSGCSLGNKQENTCYNYSNGWIQFINGTNTDTYDGTTGNTGDSITPMITTTATTYLVNLTIDEHYNPNVFKHYDALYNFSDVKWQSGANQRITKNKMIKIRINKSNIPLDAPLYKLDLRVNYSGTPLQPLEAYICNSTYTTGDPEDYSGCALVATKMPSELQDDGTKFRALFTDSLISDLGDLGWVILENHDNNPLNYYYIKTYKAKAVSYNTKWNYSTNSGSTWSNLGDGYESEMNINWFFSDTAFAYKFFINDSTGTSNTLEGQVPWTQTSPDLTPIVNIDSPIMDELLTLPYNITFIAVDPDGSEVNVSVSFNGTELINGTNLSYYYWSTGTYDGSGDLVVNVTDGINYAFDTHNITVDNTPPTVSITAPVSATYNVGDLTLISTATDTRLDSCWYNIGLTNISYTCNNNTVITLPTQGYYNLSVYANDTVGNIGSSVILNIFYEQSGQGAGAGNTLITSMAVMENYTNPYDNYYEEGADDTTLTMGGGIIPTSLLWAVDLFMERVGDTIKFTRRQKIVGHANKVVEREKELMKCLAFQDDVCAGYVLEQLGLNSEQLMLELRRLDVSGDVLTPDKVEEYEKLTLEVFSIILDYRGKNILLVQESRAEDLILLEPILLTNDRILLDVDGVVRRTYQNLAKK